MNQVLINLKKRQTQLMFALHCAKMANDIDAIARLKYRLNVIEGMIQDEEKAS